MALDTLEGWQAKGEATLLAVLADVTGRSLPALRKGLAAGIELQDLARFGAACDNDPALLERVRPWAGLVRQDSFGYPVVITPGSVYVTAAPTGGRAARITRRAA